MSATSRIEAMVQARAAARSRTMRAAILCAIAAALAGSALLGLSGWFLTGAGLAGLAGTAAAFNYLVPSAFIRLSAIVRTAARYGERLLSHKAAILSLADVRTDLLAHLAVIDPRLTGSFSTGQSIARLTSGVDALEARLVQAPARPAALAATLFALALTAWASPLALLPVALALLALPAALGQLAARSVDPHVAAAEQQQRRLKSEMTELLAAGPELAIYGLVPAATDQLQQTAAQMDGARRAAARGGAFAAGLLALSGTLLVALVLALSRGDAPVTAAAALALLAAVEVLGGPLRFRLEQARATTGLAELDELTRDTGTPETGTRREPLPPGIPALTIGGIPLQPSERLLVTGRSGSGKTSLLETLAGLRANPDVPARIDGRSPHEIDFASLSALFALTPQHPALLAGSVEDNLRLARPGLSEEQIWAALETACLAADVRALPQGLATFLGEQGARLSGGQAKRLALARALLAGRPWLLLDEPSEGLDAATEAELTRRLGVWLADTGTGALIATHRPALRALASHELRLRGEA